jgi:hypothetical protein
MNQGMARSARIWDTSAPLTLLPWSGCIDQLLSGYLFRNDGLLRQNNTAPSSKEDSQHRTANKIDKNKIDGTNINVAANGRTYTAG